MRSNSLLISAALLWLTVGCLDFSPDNSRPEPDVQEEEDVQEGPIWVEDNHQSSCDCTECAPLTEDSSCGCSALPGGQFGTLEQPLPAPPLDYHFIWLTNVGDTPVEVDAVAYHYPGCSWPAYVKYAEFLDLFVDPTAVMGEPDSVLPDSSGDGWTCSSAGTVQIPPEETFVVQMDIGVDSGVIEVRTQTGCDLEDNGSLRVGVSVTGEPGRPIYEIGITSGPVSRFDLGELPEPTF